MPARSLPRGARSCAAPPIALLMGLSVLFAGTDGLPLSSDPPPLVNQQGLVVLKTGRTIGGRISQAAGGFVVDQPHGTIVVPSELVEFTARDERDAVRLYHDRTPNPTAGFHVELAQWCLGHQMVAEAREELRSALRLEPHRADARNMLRRIDEALAPPAPEPARTSARGLIERAGFELPEATSLAGLSPDAARMFTERVQPILMNKCGNASCHGPSAENEFRLTRVRLTGGAHRVHAERNLAVTLNYVDRGQPDRSRLLVVPQGNHGRAGRTIFSGPFGGEQLETLREWVRQIASAQPEAPRDAVTAPVAGGERIPSPADAPVDAFDPAEFNRSAAALQSSRP
ncbi:MAG TPA: hypothetical protein VML55_21940 [Planctomycetaceae bacterium]|nr:hypothetical protein [Planctomycetaceae bacterium]